MENLMEAFGVDEKLQVERRISQLQQEIAKVKVGGVAVQKDASAGVPKNQRPSKPHVGRKYVLLSNWLDMSGRVPQQQADLAKILIGGMEVGKEYEEAHVFDLIWSRADDYHSLRTSRQDAVYLFRYYRGYDLKDGKHLGFVGRNFLRQIN